MQDFQVEHMFWNAEQNANNVQPKQTPKTQIYECVDSVKIEITHKTVFIKNFWSAQAVPKNSILYKLANSD